MPCDISRRAVDKKQEECAEPSGFGGPISKGVGRHPSETGQRTTPATVSSIDSIGKQLPLLCAVSENTGSGLEREPRVAAARRPVVDLIYAKVMRRSRTRLRETMMDRRMSFVILHLPRYQTDCLRSPRVIHTRYILQAASQFMPVPYITRSELRVHFFSFSTTKDKSEWIWEFPRCHSEVFFIIDYFQRFLSARVLSLATKVHGFRRRLIRRRS